MYFNCLRNGNLSWRNPVCIVIFTEGWNCARSQNLKPCLTWRSSILLLAKAGKGEIFKVDGESSLFSGNYLLQKGIGLSEWWILLLRKQLTLQWKLIYFDFLQLRRPISHPYFRTLLSSIFASTPRNSFLSRRKNCWARFNTVLSIKYQAIILPIH